MSSTVPAQPPSAAPAQPPSATPAGPPASSPHGEGVGRAGFVAEHGLHSPAQLDAAQRVAARVAELGLRTVRVVIVDQHGLPRAKSLSPAAAVAGMRDGIDFSGAIYSLDTGNAVFPPPFAPGGGFGIPELTGFPDIVIVPDPTTFVVLPWADRTGWVLCDAYLPSGAPLPLDGRAILRAQLARLGEAGYRYLAGLEVEFSLTRRTTSVIGLDEVGAPPSPPVVDVVEHGYQFLSEMRLDGIDVVLTVLRDALWDVGLPPRAMEDEWGPGQLEVSFPPMEGMAAADAMVLFRTATKQVMARRGLLASFMCKPALPGFLASGWHLHSSLLRADGTNAFTSPDADLSDIGRSYVAGLLEHAGAMTAFAVPTVNGYERFAPYSFAPDRVCWAVENRGALVRVQGGAGDPGTHLENRLGEPAANPYLYFAADLAAGLDGVNRALVPPAAAVADPYASDAPALPATLDAAVNALAADPLFREAFGTGFVDYWLMMKRAELARRAGALADGTSDADWQMREYFEVF